jgi:hypothetical protein
METHDLPLIKPAKPLEHNLLNLLGLELNSSFSTINKAYEKRKNELSKLASNDKVKNKELEILNESYENFNSDYKNNLKKIKDIKDSLDTLDSDAFCSFDEVKEQYERINQNGKNENADNAFKVISENKHFLSPIRGKRGGLLFGLSILAVGGISLAAVSANRGTEIETDMFNFNSDNPESLDLVQTKNISELSSQKALEEIHREIIVDIINDEESFQLLFSNIELSSKLSALNVLINGI